MEPSIWEMQQEAARRVERMQQASRRIAAQQGAYPPPRRTATSLRAHRPPATVFSPERYNNQNLPPSIQNLPPHSAVSAKKEPDTEQILLWMLILFLVKNGGSKPLILALLYLSF